MRTYHTALPEVFPVCIIADYEEADAMVGRLQSWAGSLRSSYAVTYELPGRATVWLSQTSWDRLQREDLGKAVQNSG